MACVNHGLTYLPFAECGKLIWSVTTAWTPDQQLLAVCTQSFMQSEIGRAYDELRCGRVRLVWDA